VFRHNWHEALGILKLVRDLGPKMEAHDYRARFRTLDTATLDLRANFRLAHLLDDRVFWEAQQHAVALTGNALQVYRDDLCGAVDLLVKGNALSADGVPMYERILAALERLSHPHYGILAELQDICGALETADMSLKTAVKFRKRSDVKSAIKKAREIYEQNLTASAAEIIQAAAKGG
jgi:hypothetical protein